MPPTGYWATFLRGPTNRVVMRAHRVLALITVAVAACGRAAVQRAAPLPAPVAEAPISAAPVVAESVTVVASAAERSQRDSVAAEADSVADQAALSALDELE